jgi:hypothetical protein
VWHDSSNPAEIKRHYDLFSTEFADADGILTLPHAASSHLLGADPAPTQVRFRQPPPAASSNRSTG